MIVGVCVVVGLLLLALTAAVFPANPPACEICDDFGCPECPAFWEETT